MPETFYDWNPGLEKPSDKVYFKWDQNAGNIVKVNGKDVRAGRPRIVHRFKENELVYEMKKTEFEEMWFKVKQRGKRKKKNGAG